jgi:hypothetical protein
MEHKLNVAQLYNVLLLLNNMLVHVMSSFNTNPFKYVLFVNSNDLVLFNSIPKLIFNNTVLNFSMLLHSFNKLALLVLLKIFHLQLVLQLVSVQPPMVKKLAVSAHHQASKAVALVLVQVLVLVMD